MHLAHLFMSKKKGLLLGLLTGATLGLLFSPEKGSKLRGQVAKKIKKHNLKEKISCMLKKCTTKKTTDQK